MNRWLLFVLTCVALTVSSSANATDDKTEEGFVSMFDGKTLADWVVTPASAKNAWSVENGMIVGEGDKGRSYLEYQKNRSVADFEMRFSYRFPGKGNSGVSIRARVDPTKTRGFQSYHADLGHVGIGKQILGAWDFHTPGRTEHACFRGDRLVIDEHDQPHVSKIEDSVNRSDIHKSKWNEVRVIAHGNNFKLFINDKLSSEFTEHLPTQKRLHRGMIQLQLHDPGMIVHYKNLRIKITK